VHRPFLPVSLLLVTFLVSCDKLTSPQPAVKAAESAETHLQPELVTRFGERVLVFAEHAHLAAGTPVTFMVHASVLATGEPVRTGVVKVRVGTREFRLENPKTAGIFAVEVTPEATGRFPLAIEVESEQAKETVDCGEVYVHPNAGAAEAAAAVVEPVVASNQVPFTFQQQWPLRLLLAKVERKDLARRLVVPASVRLPDAAQADVHAPVAGRIAPVEGRTLPRSGERVKAGEVLFSVEPPADAATIAQLHALRLELEMRLVEAVHEVEHSQLRRSFAQRELERLKALRPEGLSTLPELDAAELEVEMTLHEEELALGRKQTVERLITDRVPFDARSGSPVVRVQVTAPIDGVVTWASPSAGATVTPDMELVHIVDPSKVWIEGRVSEFDLHRVARELGATATFLGLPDERLELAGAPYIAPRVSADSRAVIVRFPAENAAGRLIEGQLAELELRTELVRGALAIPHEAIVMDQGVPTAYVMRSGELFEKRQLRLGLRDGASVEVLEGLAEGERVATRGAYIVRLASMAPASMEHHHH
jgi:multidrug efflux pump subunit AcrA (membrane-fusion protein)